MPSPFTSFSPPPLFFFSRRFIDFVFLISTDSGKVCIPLLFRLATMINLLIQVNINFQVARFSQHDFIMDYKEKEEEFPIGKD